MAIIETKIVSRPSTSIPFFNQSNNAELTAFKTAMGLTLLDNTDTYQKSTNTSGSHVIERTYSNNLLTQTNKTTFDSMTTWSMADTATSIALDREYFAYVAANGLTHPTTGQYGVTGIDASFTCTTTYNYNDSTSTGYPLFESFIDVIESSDKLTSFTNTGTQLIAVHTYTNAADFNEHHWRDGTFVTALHTGGVTRTIEYSLVGSDA